MCIYRCTYAYMLRNPLLTACIVYDAKRESLILGVYGLIMTEKEGDEGKRAARIRYAGRSFVPKWN